jgi:hypothetical protein
MSVEKVKTIADIVKIAQDVVYSHLDRTARKKAEEDAKVQRIRELEAEVERLKGGR